MTARTSKAYAELSGYWDTDDEPGMSLKEAEVRVDTLRRALWVLDKYKDWVPNAKNTPITSQIMDLEALLAWETSWVIFYLVRQGTISLDTANRMQSLPKETQINMLLNYLRPDND